MTTSVPTTTPTSLPTTAPTTASTLAAPADSRALGLAHYAARGVLEHFLARHGATFLQQVTLRAAVTAEAPQTADALVSQVRASLKSDPADVHAALGELLTRGLLVADGEHLRPTEAGRALLAAVAAESAPVSARIWSGIPAEDLAAAGRVLALVAERANAELAGLAARTAGPTH
ncbi:MarR family transcriptional regulator [Streptomyces sp. NPDC004787]|uniref:MarR family transcriptional regulator n=1 Tax=Streptomyces sp. NPDC004787 TaxID=3154291 RepID=UPI0033AEE33F